jgi:bloom syndrome protein
MSETDPQIKRQLGMGHPEIRLLYMTPETLFSNKIRADIQRAYEQKQLNRLVVDEAHVIQVSLVIALPRLN